MAYDIGYHDQPILSEYPKANVGDAQLEQAQGKEKTQEGKL
jgi:hypothetical protein